VTDLLEAPDQISPIEAYRAWEFRSEDPADPLRPLSSADDQTSPWLGAASDWVTASCRLETTREPIHGQVPNEDCRCGFYSMKSLDTLREMFCLVEPDIVLGRILLAGKVIEFDMGYRSERARIAELLPWKGREIETERVAESIGAPVGAAVDPAFELPPRPDPLDPSRPPRPLRGWVRTPLADCLATAAAA
jgi:hypothetical protein